jgi:hypothetical protein
MKQLLAYLTLIIATSATADIAVVSSNKVTRDEALAIFSFNRFIFTDGSRIKMIMLPRDNLTTREFAYAVGTTPTRLHEKAESSFSSGKLNMLRVVTSDREMTTQINLNPDAIGYVQEYITRTNDFTTVIRIR